MAATRSRQQEVARLQLVRQHITLMTRAAAGAAEHGMSDSLVCLLSVAAKAQINAASLWAHWLRYNDNTTDLRAARNLRSRISRWLCTVGRHAEDARHGRDVAQ